MKQFVPIHSMPAVALPATLPLTLDPAARKRAAAASNQALQQRRSALASSEPEDALMTGMTRSLDRRLLALNLGWKAPAGAVTPFPASADRKIA